jgi:hypothetical protein
VQNLEAVLKCSDIKKVEWNLDTNKITIYLDNNTSFSIEISDLVSIEYVIKKLLKQQ